MNLLSKLRQLHAQHKNPARELAMIGHRQRKLTERERLCATTRQLCAEMKLPVPECFR